MNTGEDLALLQRLYDLPGRVELLPAPLAGVNNTILALRAGAAELIWKIYTVQQHAAGLLYEHRLLAWLSNARCPFAVPAPLQTRDGATLVHIRGLWHALFPCLPGTRPDYSDPAQIAAVGAALGALHVTLAAYPADQRPGAHAFGEFGTVQQGAGWHTAPGTPELLAWWRAEFARVRAFAADAYWRLPRQMIHGDYAPGNTLVAGGRVTAVLDFEFAAPDVRALDLASGLTFSMRLWEHGRQWEMLRAFCEGYGRHNRLTGAEIAALPDLIALRDAVSVLWWLERGRTTGDLSEVLERIERMRQMRCWLDRHAARLVEVAARILS